MSLCSCSKEDASRRLEADRNNDESSSDEADEEPEEDTTDSGTGNSTDSTSDSDTESCSAHGVYNAGNFVIVKFSAKKSVLHYVAELLEHTVDDDNREWKVKFLRKQVTGSVPKFAYPVVEQVYDVKTRDFVLKLPPPDVAFKRHVVFTGVDFSQYNIR